MISLTHFSLFTGIGGIDLSAEWAGFTTIGQCEFADYPTKVLEKHWPTVPRWRDIRDVTLESVRSKGIRTVDLISGGFPCQPFSSPGKQKGRDDDRYLWPEMLRVIEELKPSWVIGENVAGLDGIALDEILSNLESIGYETAPPFEIPAYVFGAKHERYRIFIIAHSNGKPMLQTNKATLPIRSQWNARKDIAGGAGRDTSRTYWETHQPPICGVDDGSTNWMVRNKPSLVALGNMVMPQQVYPILQAIADIEMRDGRE